MASKCNALHRCMLFLVLLHLAGAARIQTSAVMSVHSTQNGDEPGNEALNNKALNNETGSTNAARIHEDSKVGNISEPTGAEPNSKGESRDVPRMDDVYNSTLQDFQSLPSDAYIYNSSGSAVLQRFAAAVSATMSSDVSAAPQFRYVKRLILIGSVLIVMLCVFCAVWGAAVSQKKERSTNGRQKYVSKGRVVYEWEDTPSVLYIYTKPPQGVSQDLLEVVIGKQHLQVGKRGKTPFLKDELYACVDVDGSSWSLRKGELKVVLEKMTPEKWPCVVKSHMKKRSHTEAGPYLVSDSMSPDVSAGSLDPTAFRNR